MTYPNLINFFRQKFNKKYFSHIFQHNLPSPPGSPVVTSTTSGFGTPYEYDEKDYYQHQNKGYPFSTTTTSASGNGSVPANPNSHHHPRFAI